MSKYIQKICENPEFTNIPNSGKRIALGKYNPDRLQERGFFSIDREGAEELLRFFNRPLSNDFLHKYKVFSPTYRYSSKDFSVLLKVEKGFNIEQPVFLAVEPLSGGITEVIVNTAWGPYSYCQYYTALILRNSRPGYQDMQNYTIRVFSGHGKSCTWTSAGYSDPTGEYARLFKLTEASASGRHWTTHYIAIIRKGQKLTFRSWRNTSRDNSYITTCEINGGVNCETEKL